MNKYKNHCTTSLFSNEISTVSSSTVMKAQNTEILYSWDKHQKPSSRNLNSNEEEN